MNLWDGCAKVLRTIGNIVSSDNSKCDAVLAAGQLLQGKPSRRVLKHLKTGIITLEFSVTNFCVFNLSMSNLGSIFDVLGCLTWSL